jgi:hypothetical protein
LTTLNAVADCDVDEPADLDPEHRDQPGRAPVLDRLRDDVEHRRAGNHEQRDRSRGEDRQRAGIG